MRITVTGDDVREAAGESRYARQALLPWWDQKRVSGARILVVGAGALGSEVLKTLALMGAGFLLVYDMDTIDASNLSRGILFRDADVGSPKATVAVRGVREINPGVAAVGRVENASQRAGLGVFLWADVVIGCVDNREARIFINSACARTGRVWVDGGIEGFSGVVRAFDPSKGACYECTMNETDRNLVAVRRSCAMLARAVVERGHVPTTAVAASIVGAFEVQEAVKLLHGQPALVGEGLHLDGMWNESSRVRYPRRPHCMGHDSLGPVVSLGMGSSETTLGQLIDRAERMFGEGAAIDISRDVVLSLTCPACGDTAPGRAVLGAVTERQASCPKCGEHRIVEIASSFSRAGPAALGTTIAELGLPAFDIVVARRGMEASQAWLLDADADKALGCLAPSFAGRC